MPPPTCAVRDTGGFCARETAHSGPVKDVKYSPAVGHAGPFIHARLASCSDDHAVHIFDLRMHVPDSVPLEHLEEDAHPQKATYAPAP